MQLAHSETLQRYTALVTAKHSCEDACKAVSRPQEACDGHEEAVESLAKEFQEVIANFWSMNAEFVTLTAQLQQQHDARKDEIMTTFNRPVDYRIDTINVDHSFMERCSALLQKASQFRNSATAVASKYARLQRQVSPGGGCNGHICSQRD